MHSKKKGNIGQFITAFKFSEYNFSVFTEEGDISTIDMIVEKCGKIYRIQCKAITPKNGSLDIPLCKSGKGYRRKYQDTEIDFFSVYDLQNKKIYLVPSNILQTHSAVFKLRILPTKNKQNYGVNLAHEFEFDKMIQQIN